MSVAREIPYRAEPPEHFRRGARPNAHQARRASTILGLAKGLSGVALDYGAGWGDLTAQLAPQFTRIIGVDADAARMGFAEREFAPIEFSVCAPDQLSFPDAMFDVVFSIAVLPFVPSPEGHLAECRRVLRPGGDLIIMIGNPESMWMQSRRLVGRHVLRQEWGGTSRAEFRDFLATCGFDVVVETGFYDPPNTHLKTPGDVAIALMNVAGNALNLRGYWSYVAYRCRLRA